MNQNKKKALIQSIFSVLGIVVILFMQTTTSLKLFIKCGIILFFTLLMFDGLKRLSKKEEAITAEEAGSFDKVFKDE